ncbi:arginine--tRNA ligase, partial [candidate division WOR-3 bacterium]|nr:arginine--tRNA ligase [candidate division WOR-3 bacterium]
MRIKEKINKWLNQSTGMSIDVATTRNPAFGDYTTNIAFSVKGNPEDNANKILSNIDHNPDIVDKIESKNGFINIFLSKSALLGVIDSVRIEGEQYGSYNKGKGKKILLEFVSANPT